MKKLLCVLMFVAFAVPSFAFDFNMGPVKGQLVGVFYLDTVYHYVTKDGNMNNSHWLVDWPVSGSGSGLPENSNTFDFRLGNRSRIGVGLEWNKMNAYVDVQANLDEPMRQYYIGYDFGEFGSISIGKQWTLAAYYFAQEMGEYNLMIDYGAVSDFRQHSIIYTIKGLQIGLAHDAGDSNTPGLTADIIPSDYQVKTSKKQYLPRIELAYTFSNDLLEVKLYGAYSHYALKGYTADFNSRTFEKNVYLVGLGGQFNISDAFVQYNGYYGVNLAMSGVLTHSKLMPKYNAEKDKIEDVNSFGFLVGLGWKIGKFTPQVGYGYSYSDSSSWKHKNEAQGVYFNVLCKLNDYITLIPEVDWFDDMRDQENKNEGYQIYAGVIAKIEF